MGCGKYCGLGSIPPALHVTPSIEIRNKDTIPKLKTNHIQLQLLTPIINHNFRSLHVRKDPILILRISLDLSTEPHWFASLRHPTTTFNIYHCRAMENLSPETIHHILGYLSEKRDIESFRLVQHSFAIIGKEFLFHTIDVWPTRASLNRLRMVSRSSDLAMHVKVLTLNVVYDTKSLMWGRIKGNLHRLDIGHGPIRVSYEHNIGVFREAAAEYYDFLASRDHVSILMASLAGLPRLETVRMIDGRNEGCSVTAKEEKTYFGTSGIRNYAGEPGSLVDPNSYFAIEALRAILDAARYTDIKITSFQAINEIPQVIFEDPTLLNNFAGFIQNCRDLQLRFDTEDHEEVIHHLQNNPPAVIFSCTKALEKLGLHFSVRPDITVPFAKLLGSQQISACLKDISFVGIDMHEEELCYFLGLHKKSLRRFSIQYSKLFTGRWLDVATWIRNNLRLVSVEFAGITDSDADETINMTEEEAAGCRKYVKLLEEYVLHGRPTHLASV